MQAMITSTYGSPDVLLLQEIAKPTPKANEVLIRVHAVSAGPADCAFRKGEPFVVRVLYGLRRPRISVGGVEVAGTVEAVGSAVTLFKPGDRVMGLSADRFGGYAEYLCLGEDKPLIAMPPSMRFEQAVALLDGPPTALTFLRRAAHVQPGQRVLINGASGSVGGAAVQLAKHMGAHVTGVCSGANLDLVRAMGADAVIDYTREDFAHGGERYDVIFDAVGKLSFGQCQGALTSTGIYLTTVPTMGMIGPLLWTALRGGKKAKFVTAGFMQSKESLTELCGLVESGALHPQIDRTWPLAQAADAHRYVETERKRGTVVLMV